MNPLFPCSPELLGGPQNSPLMFRIIFAGNGEIEFGQFLDIVFKKTTDYKHEEELRLAFSTYDLEGNGRISMTDFEYIIESLKLTDQEITDMKKEADRKGLGYVAYDGKSWVIVFEPRHDKTIKVSVRPAKAQISLGGCPG